MRRTGPFEVGDRVQLTDAKGDNNAAWEPFDKPLVKRATTAFQVARN